MVHANLIANYSVTPENISHTHKLFGENLSGLRGKTVWKKSEWVVTDYVQIPRDMIQTNEYVTLTVDEMFVNKLPFVITYGRRIGLIMVDHMAKQLASNLDELLPHILEQVLSYKL